MKKSIIFILALAFMLLSSTAFAAIIGDKNYKQNVIVSAGGENMSSSSYKMGIAAGIINSIIRSSSYINSLGFFHALMLADGQPCSSAGQCEGGFCCSSVCASSGCPVVVAGGGGGAGGGAGGGGGSLPLELINATAAQLEEGRFSVSPSSIKEQLALGAEKTAFITVKNTRSRALSFDLSIEAINEFASLQDSRFTLEPGQEKSVGINIIGKRLGSYFGELIVSGNGIKKSASLVVEIHSEQVLFDVKLDIPATYKEIEAGGELRTQITLLNIGPSKKVDVTPTYIIKDRQGKTVEEFSETFSIEKQISYVKSFKIGKNSLPGDYLAVVELKYENSFAVSSDLFKVVLKKLIAGKIANLYSLSSMFLIIFAAIIIAFFYFKFRKKGGGL